MFDFYVGKWDGWGFEISYCQPDYSLTFGFIHWYLIISYVPKRFRKS